METTKDLPHIGPAEPATTTTPVAVSNSDQPFEARPFGPLIGFLEVGESELTNKNETTLNEIWEYLAKESKSELTSERLHALRVLESKLSPPKLGQSRLQKIAAYIQAQKVVDDAEKWRDGHLRSI